MLRDTKYLYSDIWIDFCRDFGFELKDIAGPRGRVFANFRGLAMSTAGLATHIPDPRHVASPGKGRFPKFGDDADPRAPSDERASSEANAVVKAFWPFVRRMKTYADSREYVACGVMNWRALYVTALGSESGYDEGGESLGRQFEDPYGSLPELADEKGKTWRRNGDDPQIGPNDEEPVRYLILTKHEPHRRQLGRIVDRINAMGTMRLFALKNLSLIREASGHIRLRGQQLDDITAWWIQQRQDIRETYKTSKQDDDAKDEQSIALADLNKKVEDQLLAIGSALNKIGRRAVGGLSYRISRSKLYAQRFDDLRKDLLIGNIESWVSYNQFALRSLQPLFDFIDSVGVRLERLRGRVAIVMENIQTAAIVSQTEETRYNTRELQRLQASATNLGVLGAFAIFLSSIEPISIIVDKSAEGCFFPIDNGSVIIGSAARCEIFNELFGPRASSAFWSMLLIIAAVLLIAAVFLTTKREGLSKLATGLLRFSIGAVLYSVVAWSLIYAGKVAGAPLIILQSTYFFAFIAALAGLLGWFIARRLSNQRPRWNR
ncbi:MULTISPECIES: hypothetical protein [Rhodomicrobium]|uniref:hypothetical protein n=1 Tax=Rhodomicrobium TaxID=1068 RepID=UPI000B4B1323|nr:MULTISPECIES: hypothetical protein [Rhodomicrobium]